jgi:hypothetical protein
MKRTERIRLSITAGNAVQGTMLVAGVVLLWLSSWPLADVARVIGMVAGYLLIYFSVHATAHWLVGRLFGIRFTHYSVGGSTHTSTYPPGMRQVFARLPFFAVHADKASLKAASPFAKALMFGAGMTSSVVLSTLAALWCATRGAPGGTILLIVNVIWFIGALVAEMRTHGDYAKAARALNPALTPTLSQRERE